MKAIVVALCLALLPFALAQSAEDAEAEGSIIERVQGMISDIFDRALSLCLQALFYLNTLVYRLTGGRFGAEAYCI